MLGDENMDYMRKSAHTHTLLCGREKKRGFTYRMLVIEKWKIPYVGHDQHSSVGF